MENRKDLTTKLALIATFENVSKRLDREIVHANYPGGLHKVEADLDANIAAHFHRGIPIRVNGKKRPVVLNLHFFGATEADLGKKLNWSVQQWERTVTKDGVTNVYTEIDLHKVEGKPVADLKLNVDRPDQGGEIEILNTDAFLRIEPRLAAQTTAVQANLNAFEEINSL